MDDQTGKPTPEPPVEAELAAMSVVANALETLTDPVRARVIHWAAERYGVGMKRSGGQSPRRSRGAEERDVDDDVEDLPVTGYDTFAELFDRLSPRNDGERVLAAMYWLQVVGDQATVQSLDMTKILTDLGHRVDRIRDVLPGLQSGKPALVLQVRHGAGPQGRRVVKLSKAGVNAVGAALAAGGFENFE